MATIDHEARRITAKIVYWGPPGSGKWTNLEHVHRSTSPPDRPPVAKAGSVGFPLALGEVRGYRLVLSLLRCPSDGAWNRHVFDEIGDSAVDGVVFVADATASAQLANLASLHKLTGELSARGFDLGKLPAALQYNKVDLPQVQTVEALRRQLNPWNHPDGEAVASQGRGVFETVKQVARGILKSLS